MTRTIILQDKIVTRKFAAFKRAGAKRCGARIGTAPTGSGNCYILTYGRRVDKAKNGVCESGFFFDSYHIDTIGFGLHSSLTTPQCIKMVEEFHAPKSAASIVLDSTIPSKFRQPNIQQRWNDVVLAAQLPRDRSICQGHSVYDYWRFVKGACKFYGKHLFVKCHPYAKKHYARFARYANKYGCKIGYCDHSVIKHCKFVLTWNSTFAVDCFLRGVPVAQFAPGYFYQQPAVTYTEGQYPDSVADTVDAAYKLADFLIWRYCYNGRLPFDDIWRIILAFSKSEQMFPLPEELSFGATHS